jgi:hypothetical protein
MLPAIQLNDEPPIETYKIYNVRAYELLAAELATFYLPSSYLAPKQLFRVGGLSTKSAGVLG